MGAGAYSGPVQGARGQECRAGLARGAPASSAVISGAASLGELECRHRDSNPGLAVRGRRPGPLDDGGVDGYWVREEARRLRVHALDIVRTAVVAGAAFGLAGLVHRNPLFAPIAATLVMTAAAGTTPCVACVAPSGSPGRGSLGVWSAALPWHR